MKSTHRVMKILNEASEKGISVYVHPSTDRPLSYNGGLPTYEVRVEKNDHYARTAIDDSCATLSEFIEEAINLLEDYIRERKKKKASQ